MTVPFDIPNRSDIRVDGEQNSMTTASDLSANSTGTGTIKMKGATSRNSAGFAKMRIGQTDYWVPVFSAITG